MNKTFIRLFTISDYEEEEAWLRRQHNNGWKLLKTTLPCFYVFESCEPEDVIYRLDYKNSEQTEEYMQMCKDFNWDNFNQMAGWLYFRKSASEVEAEGDGELFSDRESKMEMINHIVQTRILPLLIILFCCVLPSCINGFFGVFSGIWGVIVSTLFSAVFVIYLYIFLHCGLKLKRMKDKLKIE